MHCEDRCRLEVAELHRFFQGWFRGELPDTNESFDRFSGVMADEFEMVAPDGKAINRAAILDTVGDGHGKEPGAEIWIENHRHRLTVGGVSLVTYEEWQDWGGRKRGRLSSALMQTAEDTPNGVHWLHVHETWLPE
jgi:hypothetical protein